MPGLGKGEILKIRVIRFTCDFSRFFVLLSPIIHVSAHHICQIYIMALGFWFRAL